MIYSTKTTMPSTIRDPRKMQVMCNVDLDLMAKIRTRVENRKVGLVGSNGQITGSRDMAPSDFLISLAAVECADVKPSKRAQKWVHDRLEQKVRDYVDAHLRRVRDQQKRQFTPVEQLRRLNAQVSRKRTMLRKVISWVGERSQVTADLRREIENAEEVIKNLEREIGVSPEDLQRAARRRELNKKNQKKKR